MSHIWGDDWPYWVELYKAERFFNKLFFKCTGKRPITKEKYGTIRYEFVGLWLDSKLKCDLFKECIRRTVKKFPNVAGEVCHAAGHVLNDEFFEGWCAGVAATRTGAYWSSNKRPKGV